jgi:hypothetical protein
MDSVTDTKPIALGIDFEHIRHTPAYRCLDSKNEISVDISAVTDRLLALFDQYDTNVTFFVVSELAEEHPEAIQRIDQGGHEIASHTKYHRSLPDLSEEALEQAIVQSKEDLESIVGHPIRGFRAPTCEIDARSYRLLAEAGYEYSSSVMPSIPIPGFYSATNIPDYPSRILTNKGEINELPVAVSPGIQMPVSGAWIRLLGRRYTLMSMRRKSSSGVVCTYSHPWEFQQMEKPLPFRCRYRTGEWLWKTYERILRLDREFLTCSEVCDRIEFDTETRVQTMS